MGRADERSTTTPTPTFCGTTEDALARLLAPSLEREIRRELTSRVRGARRRGVRAQPARQAADAAAARPPRAGRRSGLPHGLQAGRSRRDGQSGRRRSHLPAHSAGPRRAEAKVRLEELVRKHQIQVIAIGNGTACRETEEVVSELIADLDARRHGGRRKLSFAGSRRADRTDRGALPPPW